VLQTDDLMAIAVAIERGRATYTNVRKAVRYLLGTNLSEIAVVLAATSAGFSEPLSPIQLLWINLVSDVLPGLGLAFEAPEPGLLTRPPLANGQGILGERDLRSLTIEGGVIAGGALAACGYGVLRYGVSPEARAITMGSLVIAQLLHALTCRASTRNTPPIRRNLPLAGALGLSFAAQAAIMLLPGLGHLLGTAPLGPLDLAVTVGSGMLPYLINEARKPERQGRIQPRRAGAGMLQPVAAR
jgi:P-type Ca2+ transporter type 2C